MIRFSEGCKTKYDGGAKTNCTLHILFMKCFGTPKCLVSFDTGSLGVHNTQSCVQAGIVAPTRAIEAVLTEKNQCRTSEQVKTGFQ